MKEIMYQMADGQTERIMVSEEFYAAYEKIDKEYKRNDEKHAWRKRKRETSFEFMKEEKGFDVQAGGLSVEEQVMTTEFISSFMPLLTEAQKTIFKKVYIESKSLRQTAKEINIKLGNVQKQILSIQKKFLKNFSKTGGQKA